MFNNEVLPGDIIRYTRDRREWCRLVTATDTSMGTFTCTTRSLDIEHLRRLYALWLREPQVVETENRGEYDPTNDRVHIILRNGVTWNEVDNRSVNEQSIQEPVRPFAEATAASMLRGGGGAFLIPAIALSNPFTHTGLLQQPETAEPVLAVPKPKKAASNKKGAEITRTYNLRNLKIKVVDRSSGGAYRRGDRSV